MHLKNSNECFKKFHTLAIWTVKQTVLAVCECTRMNYAFGKETLFRKYFAKSGLVLRLRCERSLFKTSYQSDELY